MKNNCKIYFLSILIYSCSLFWKDSGAEAFAQNKNIDSLLILLKKDKADTSKVNHLYTLCGEYRTIGLYDSAIYFGNLASQLAKQLLLRSDNTAEIKRIKKHYANSIINLGNV